MRKIISVNTPCYSEKAKEYVNKALESNWISSTGEYVDKFENKFAEYIGVKHATTCVNGTAALHLAVNALGIGKGDEVIVPDLTIISCALAVVYNNAKPVFVDVEPDTGNIDPLKIESAITARTKAIMIVHLYGHPVDFEPIRKIAKKHNLYIIEDAAEAHGAMYESKRVGSLGDISCFSFYANKIVTTGEGGMVMSDDKNLIDIIRRRKDLAHVPGKRFYHEEIGYNFRMTNIQAAIGLAHLEDIEKYINRKRAMAKLYDRLLSDITYLRLPIEKSYAKSVYWMFAILTTKGSPVDRDSLMVKLRERGIDTRSFFYPLHVQPVLRNISKSKSKVFPVSDDLSHRGLYLPSGLALSDKEITNVAEAIHDIFGRNQ